MRRTSFPHNKIPAEKLKSPGIYFLYQDDRIVYIGRSAFPEGRIIEHMKGSSNIGKWMPFNFYSVIRCDESSLNELEKFYIHKYDPVFNKKRFYKIPLKKHHENPSIPILEKKKHVKKELSEEQLRRRQINIKSRLRIKWKRRQRNSFDSISFKDWLKGQHGMRFESWIIYYNQEKEDIELEKAS